MKNQIQPCLKKKKSLKIYHFSWHFHCIYPDRPGHPSKPTIRNQVGTAVHLEWSPPPQMQSGQIQGYTIEFREAGQLHHQFCCSARLSDWNCLSCFVCVFLVVIILFWGVWGVGWRVFFSDYKTKADLKIKNKSSETRLTASFPKQNPNTWKLQQNAIY